MGCRKLQLSDYLQLVSHHEVHEAGSSQSRATISPRQNDSLKTALLAKQTINGILLFYSYTKYNQLTKSTTRNSQFVIRNYSYDYHVSGQIASATTLTTEGTEHTESYDWDGLALIKRGTTSYTNEPAVTGGNPILADNNVLFNDMLGTTIGIAGSNGKKSFTPTAITAFGESTSKGAFFTGKPHVAGLGYAFLFRNYRANLGKWQTADPLGYPDGWNNLAYVNNGVTSAIDWLGGEVYYLVASKAVNGYGHAASIVGNPTFGYRIINHGTELGAGYDYNGWEHKFNKLSDAIKTLQKDRTGDYAFDHIIKFSATPVEDDIAYAKMLEYAKPELYGNISNNCLNPIVEGLNAANISNDDIGITLIPNSFYNDNVNQYATFLKFNDVLNGVAE
jgi:RHS repeat-associated protein